MNPRWIAERMSHIEASGIRKIFELARSVRDPINLSIGQPHFDVPSPIKDAAQAAIAAGRNAYTLTQGIAELRAKLSARIQQRYPHPDREVLVTSGTSGGLVLALCTTVNPGDEVIFFDPYFVMYPSLVALAGGVPVVLDTYPDFRIDVDRLRSVVSPRTKAIIVNTPANPTGAVLDPESLRDLAQLARERDILLISDEVYSAYCYDSPFVSPAQFNPDVLVLDGFSKTYSMTGWRLGFAHGPRRLIDEMAKLQQFTFVCAPSMVQYAGLAALDFDVTEIVADYRRKRDRVCAALRDRFELVEPGGAFYVFPKVPWGSGSEFVTEAIRHSLLVIPGAAFSRRDTHFRLSFAADDRTLDRGLEVLDRMARR
ncbi:MAG: aminotransferase class I/II-fold pyridoxal phosphate-dependent enzyme [Gemmataceae bacterium]|nr:aminotransferase class I/II-fold pyridoxal phosphate-dependent enzyme [Gemmataceae bacterium]MDW8266215.1 aminotransferase class I/II-fold pyridoxal phosphate-dependent enzyme [Gemmataceae bacterium]